MMDKLVMLFEQILHVYKDNQVILRTLYFSRREFDPLCKPDTVTYFFPILFGSVPLGYKRLIHSLLQSKHIEAAQNVLQEFQDWTKENPRGKAMLKQATNELASAVQ